MCHRRALVGLRPGARVLREDGARRRVVRLGRDVDAEAVRLELRDRLVERQPLDRRHRLRVLLREDVPGDRAGGEEQQQHAEGDRDRVARPAAALLDLDRVAVDRPVRVAPLALAPLDDDRLGLESPSYG